MGLPGDLAEIDGLLDDPRFFEPFRAFFDPTHGSAVDPDGDLPADDVPQVPVPARLRAVVSRRWPTRLAGGGSAGSRSVRRVPHPTTLMKITTRCGARAIDGLNEALLAKAHRGQA